MDWSSDISEVQTSPQPHISLAGENMSLPYIPLPNKDSSRKSKVEPNNSGLSVLDYSNNQWSVASSWDGAHQVLSIFRTRETTTINTANISLSITRITDYLKHNPAREFVDIVRAFWSLIVSVYSAR